MAFAQAVQTAYENDQSAAAVKGDDAEQTVIQPYQQVNHSLSYDLFLIIRGIAVSLCLTKY